MASLGDKRDPDRWRPPIVRTVASRGEGIDDVVEALDKHAAWMGAIGELPRRRRARAASEVEAIAVTALRERLGDLRGGEILQTLADQVVAGTLDPYAAADELVGEVAELANSVAD